MTEGAIAMAIAEYYGLRSLILVNNCNCFLSVWGEADLLHVTNSGYLEEIEIKTSVSDFKREFVFNSKKRKHEFLQNSPRSNTRRFYIAMPESVYKQVSELVPSYAGVFVINNDETHKALKVKNAKDFKQAGALKPDQIRSLAAMACSRLWNLKLSGECGRK